MSDLVLAVTPGDPAGIGPEILWKTIRKRKIPKDTTLVCIGAVEPFLALKAKLHILTENQLKSGLQSLKSTAQQGTLMILPAPKKAPGKLLLSGYQAGWSIQRATQLVKAGLAQALVTGPIHKERLQHGGFIYPGHTEFLADLFASSTKKGEKVIPEVTMMLANDQLRVSLVTTHLPISAVPTAINSKVLEKTIIQTAHHLKKWWGISRPIIGVAALNPHAGEGGLFGDEENKIISPTLDSLRPKLGPSVRLIGPLPADTLFARQAVSKKSDRFDCVVCMYHDQGLIPVKLLDFPNTVNITLGLPMIRTSVDHGVGFDIVGKDIADPSSLQAAILMASQLAKRTRKTRIRTVIE